MKRITVLLLLLSFASPIHGAQHEPSQPSWLILLFAEACNNLHSTLLSTVADLFSIGSSKQTTILLDWHHLYERTWRGKVEKDQFFGQVYEHNTLSPLDRLQSFIRWGITTYPADHICLILAGHSEGVLNADQEQESVFSFHHLAQIIASSLQGQKLDIIGFDSCSMAMLEIGYTLAPYATILIASQEQVSHLGWNYPLFLTTLQQNPGFSKEALAHTILSSFQHLQQQYTTLYTLSAIDLTALPPAVEAFSTLVHRLLPLKDDIHAVTTQARTCCYHCTTPEFIDLRSWYDQLLITPSLPDDLYLSIKEGIEKLEASLLGMVKGPYYGRSHGISLYFPRDLIEHSYLTSSFCKTTAWHTFLLEKRLFFLKNRITENNVA